jgi:hypothetical protein
MCYLIVYRRVLPMLSSLPLECKTCKAAATDHPKFFTLYP